MYSFDCPRCGGSDIVKRGKRYNVSGIKQLYRCNDCRSAFVEPNGFERMRHQPEDIVRSVHQHNDGFSLFQVQYHLAQHDNVGLKHNNNHIERHNGKIKDRVKTMRGGFGSFKGAEVFMNLRHIIHNSVNPHQGLKGKTPAEAAEIVLPLGRNKLLGLINTSQDAVSRKGDNAEPQKKLNTHRLQCNIKVTSYFVSGYAGRRG